MLNLGELVIAQGGWGDPAAVAGSIRMVAQNISMGRPWVGEDCQTSRQLYNKLTFGYTEEFTECWQDFKTILVEMEADESGGDIGGGKSASSAAAQDKPVGRQLAPRQAETTPPPAPQPPKKQAAAGLGAKTTAGKAAAKPKAKDNARITAEQRVKAMWKQVSGLRYTCRELFICRPPHRFFVKFSGLKQ